MPESERLSLRAFAQSISPYPHPEQQKKQGSVLSLLFVGLATLLMSWFWIDQAVHIACGETSFGNVVSKIMDAWAMAFFAPLNAIAGGIVGAPNSSIRTVLSIPLYWLLGFSLVHPLRNCQLPLHSRMCCGLGLLGAALFWLPGPGMFYVAWCRLGPGNN